MTRGLRLLPALAALSLLAGCPPARVLPPALTEEPAPVSLAKAEAAFALRPDAAQVRKALGLFQAAAAADPSGLDGPEGVVRAVAWLLEHGATGDRGALAATGLQGGQQCQQRAPGTPRCDYWLAVARGLAIRENPALGLSEVGALVALLSRVEGAQPELDEGGPCRTLAFLLVRAPGWPVGPGDPEAALVQARRAVEVGPKHPLNHLALGEALAATGDAEGAKAAYGRAAAVARERAAAGDPDGPAWAVQAEAAARQL